MSRLHTVFRSLRPALAVVAVAGSLTVALPARALETPSAGYYKVGMHGNTWGGGTTAVFGNISSGVGAEDSAMTSFDNQVSSFSICNYTGASRTFTVNLYDSYNYVTLLEGDSVTVADGQCVVKNVSSSNNDKTSSFKVKW
jgi:hypothetical protein